MKIGVIGTGYVGLVTGTCFAETGNEVICVDNNPAKLAALNNGVLPIYEPGLKNIFDRSVREGRLTFTENLEKAVDNSDIIFLCLPTPPGANGQADLRFVLDVASEIGKLLKSYKVIVNKSTVPVGTADKVKARIKEQTNLEFDVVSNPEFLREGVAVEDFMKPERVVIGSSSDRASELMKELYEPFVRSGNPIIIMDERSSELTKYAANAFLATKITFMNEIANVCERVGADVDNVRRGIGTDSRIGKRFLFPGIGYGGSCFPKDVQALDFTSDEYEYNFRILKSVMEVNEAQKVSIIPKIQKFFNGDLKGKNIAVWGLAFKPETDDVREAPALYVVDELLKAGARVQAFDPEAIETFKIGFGVEKSAEIDFKTSAMDAVQGADALVICTEWNEFRRPDFKKLKATLTTPVIFDGRNLFDLNRMEEAGFVYISVGRRSVNV
ncbi:MAG: UDP-glucose/GDP-mannose dehydrogenase family protein [Bacteroidetes bacterium]|nr:UDP-glucose/GDP-mannose dehydrogenase family protein [Bacteroidota bacterium]